MRQLSQLNSTFSKLDIAARVVDVPLINAGEYAENGLRKDFTPSENVGTGFYLLAPG
jgi:hypothetical protein